MERQSLLEEDEEVGLWSLKLQTACAKLRNDLAFDVIMEFIDQRCFMHETTIVLGDPIQTYANEHLRDFALELHSLLTGKAFKQPVKPVEEDDHEPG